MNFEIVKYDGIRYKVFLCEKKTEEDSGISTVHIQKSSESDEFRKMTIDEITEYVGSIVRHILATNFVGEG